MNYWQRRVDGATFIYRRAADQQRPLYARSPGFQARKTAEYPDPPFFYRGAAVFYHCRFFRQFVCCRYEWGGRYSVRPSFSLFS